jgi:hypothetical protein
MIPDVNQSIEKIRAMQYKPQGLKPEALFQTCHKNLISKTKLKKTVQQHIQKHPHLSVLQDYLEPPFEYEAICKFNTFLINLHNAHNPYCMISMLKPLRKSILYFQHFKSNDQNLFRDNIAKTPLFSQGYYSTGPFTLELENHKEVLKEIYTYWHRTIPARLTLTISKNNRILIEDTITSNLSARTTDRDYLAFYIDNFKQWRLFVTTQALVSL